MQRLVVSTDDVPEAERFSYWREMVSEGIWGDSGEPNKDQETPYNGRIVASISGSLRHFRCRVDGHPVFRRPRNLARRSGAEQIMLYRELSVVAWSANAARREFITRPGDLVVSDRSTPIAVKPPRRYDFEAWWLPRELIAPHLPASPSLHSRILSGRDGVAGIVRAYLDALTGQFAALDDHEADLLADNIGRLLAVAFGASVGEHSEAIRVARLEEAKRYIDRHLADPELTPEKTASALQMSVRRLHLLFEPSGTSFAQYVLKRRLEECRAALANPVGGRSIADIALSFGFNSLATFHRNFRRAFGATAGEMRARIAEPGGSAAPPV